MIERENSTPEAAGPDRILARSLAQELPQEARRGDFGTTQITSIDEQSEES